MDFATPTLPTLHALGDNAVPTHRVPSALDAAPPRHSGLAQEDEFLLPLLAWSDPIVEPEQRRVLAVLDWLAEQAPDCIDAASLGDSVRGTFARAVLEVTHRVLLLEWGRQFDSESVAQLGTRDFAAFAAVIAEPVRRRRIENDYPLLAQDVFQRARQTARILIAMLRRVTRDHAMLHVMLRGCQQPGRLRRFRCGLGHRYFGGQSASELEFERGQLVYKPKPLAADAAFSDLLGWMAAQGAGPEQYRARLLDRGDYGYQEWLPALPATDARARADYYHRYGALLAPLYLLGAAGLEPGSLTACGAYPVLLDAELVLQPAPAGRRSKSARRDPYAASVLSSGLLPHGESDAANSANVGAPSQLLLPHECLFGPTESAAEEETAAEPAQYAGHLCAGFETAYAALLDHKQELLGDDGPLARFKTAKLRLPLRRTREYEGILDALLHPDCMRLVEKREAVLRRLGREGGTRLQQLCRHVERAALMRGDVPYVYAGADDCEACDAGGNPLGKAFGGSAWNEMQKRLRALSPNDLRRQAILLRDALSAAAPSCELPAKPVAGTAQRNARSQASACMAAAVDIGDRLLASGFRDGVLLRYRQVQNDRHGKARLMELGTRLYDELAGIALFLGELHVHCGAARFLRGAERILQTIRHERLLLQQGGGKPCEGLGGFSGLGGWAYVLAFLGLRWSRGALVEEALSLLPDIRLAIAADVHLNVVGGAAGALLVLCEIDRVAPFRGALPAAQLCAAHLAVHARKDKRGARWDCADYRVLDSGTAGGTAGGPAPVGFARGNAGIAAALGRFGAHAGQEKYLALAREAIRYERAALAGFGLVNPGAGWCCGAPGIGLGRLALPFEMRDEAWRLEVEHCVQQVRSITPGTAHTLGHGNLGELELLVAHALQFPGKESAHAVVRFARELVDLGEAGWRSECGPGYGNHGFISGLAGIGYGLLRVAKPHHVPAASLLELPHQYGAL